LARRAPARGAPSCARARDRGAAATVAARAAWRLAGTGSAARRAREAAACRASRSRAHHAAALPAHAHEGRGIGLGSAGSLLWPGAAHAARESGLERPRLGAGRARRRTRGGRGLVTVGDMRNLRFAVEYDGTEFSGWQMQPGLRTVQGTLEDALGVVLGEPIRVRGAGRTDAGCHARGQVANARTGWPPACDRVRRSLARLLPQDGAVREVREVSLGFDSRRRAVDRRYEYRLLLQPSPLLRRFAWYPGFRPDRRVLEESVAPLVGERDF